LKDEFMNTSFISVRGIRTRYVIVGHGAPVVFIHGFPENLYTWRFYIPLLSPRLRLILFDLKGFGATDKPLGGYSPWALADFVKDFFDALKVEKAHLVATDIGFTVACAFAIKYPASLDKLVLMAGAVSKEGISAPEVRLLSVKPWGEFILKYLGRYAIKMGLQKGFYQIKIPADIFNEYYAPCKEFQAQRALLELLRSFDEAGPEVLRRVSEISCPTLILWAEKERFFTRQSAESLRAKIKCSRLEIIPACGHFIQEERPKESAKIIEAFLCGY